MKSTLQRGTGTPSDEEEPLASVGAARWLFGIVFQVLADWLLARFMDDWYVIANIPTFLEEDAHNAVESNRLAPDGSIDTTFTFRAGGFDGEEKR